MLWHLDYGSDRPLESLLLRRASSSPLDFFQFRNGVSDVLPEISLFAALVLSIVLCRFSCCSLRSQKQTQDPSEKPRNVKPELKKAYKDWLDKDVTYVITDEERKAFKKLATDDERERFIEDFWRRRIQIRTPTRTSSKRNTTSASLMRMNISLQEFLAGKQTAAASGSCTASRMGSRPIRWAEFTIVRPTKAAATSTYPFEIWFYRYFPGVGSGIEIEFVDPTGSGEYRIARNPNEKDALLMVPGAGLTLSEQLGLSDQARSNPEQRLEPGRFTSASRTARFRDCSCR